MFEKIFSFFSSCKSTTSNQKTEIDFSVEDNISPTITAIEQVRFLNKNSFKKYEQACNQYSTKKSSLELQKISYPEFRVIQDEPSTTAAISSCCAIIVYSKSNPEYLLAHYNSATYYPSYDKTERTVKGDLEEIFKYFEKKDYEATVVGGDSKFFKEIEEILKLAHIPIVSSYQDHHDQQNFDLGLLDKQIIFDPKKGLSIFSAEFPEGSITLKKGEHLTFSKNFASHRDKLVHLSEEVLANEQLKMNNTKP